VLPILHSPSTGQSRPSAANCGQSAGHCAAHRRRITHRWHERAVGFGLDSVGGSVRDGVAPAALDPLRAPG